MYKNFNKFILVGILFTISFGALLHFVYEWSGHNVIVGLFSPINESVWELLYYPMSFYAIYGYFKYGKRNRNYFTSVIAGFLCGAVSIPLLFYLYTAVINRESFIIDISIFVISCCLAFLVMGYLYKNYNFHIFSIKSGIFVWEFIFAILVFFTIFSPKTGIFHPHP